MVIAVEDPRERYVPRADGVNQVGIDVFQVDVDLQGEVLVIVAAAVGDGYELLGRGDLIGIVRLAGAAAVAVGRVDNERPARALPQQTRIILAVIEDPLPLLAPAQKRPAIHHLFGGFGPAAFAGGNAAGLDVPVAQVYCAGILADQSADLAVRLRRHADSVRQIDPAAIATDEPAGGSQTVVAAR